MNGRIYDPLLGRFLSADLVVQAPGDLQAYNRYSYVKDNPLTLTDPTGFNWLDDQVQQMKDKEAGADAQRAANNKATENSTLGTSAGDRICGDLHSEDSAKAAASVSTGAATQTQGASGNQHEPTLSGASQSGDSDKGHVDSSTAVQAQSGSSNSAHTPTKPSKDRKYADKNLHAPNVWGRPYRNGPLGLQRNHAGETKIYPANFYVICAHGDHLNLYDRGGDYVFPGKYDPEVDQSNRDAKHTYDINKLITAIDQQGGWKPGMPMYVEACEAAKGENSLCQQLANHYHTEVVGWDVECASDDSVIGIGPWGSHMAGHPGGDRQPVHCYWDGK